MRHDVRLTGGGRSSALWGKRSGSRASALWGKKGRGAIALLGAVLIVLGATAPVAGANATPKSAKATPRLRAFVTRTLLTAAQKSPTRVFEVIVQGDTSDSTSEVSSSVTTSFETDRRKPHIRRNSSRSPA